MTWQENYLNKVEYIKLKEKLFLSQFDRIDEEMSKNKDFEELMKTPVKDLPENWAFSFDNTDWDYFKTLTKNNTYYDFLKYLTVEHNDYILFSSENNNNKLLGWMVYQAPSNGSLVGNIKFGSFTENERDNLELLQDVRKEFFRLLNKGYLILWAGDEHNTKVFNMYKKIIERYNGVMKDLGSGIYRFGVSKEIKLNEIPDILDIVR